MVCFKIFLNDFFEKENLTKLTWEFFLGGSNFSHLFFLELGCGGVKKPTKN